MLKNAIADTAMWDSAVADVDAEQHARVIAKATVALAGTWPFLAAAGSQEEFEHRLALMSESVVRSTPPEVLDEVVAGLRQKFTTVLTERLASGAQRRTAARTIALGEGQVSLPDSYVHVHKHAADGDDEYWQVDHVAGPTFINTVGHKNDRDAALQLAREYNASTHLPLYENGKHVEGARAEGEYFFHQAAQCWVPLRAIAAGEGPDDESMSHEALVADEYSRFNRSPDWELGNIHKALNMMPFLNGPREIARLEAVKRIKAERSQRRRQSSRTAVQSFRPGGGQGVGLSTGAHERLRGNWGDSLDPAQAAYQPDPLKGWRYHYPDTPAAPAVGGQPTGPTVGQGVAQPETQTSVGPDGFPLDVAQGENRSEQAYAFQTTPGQWVAPPGGWPAGDRPNAATGMPQGQFPRAGSLGSPDFSSTASKGGQSDPASIYCQRCKGQGMVNAGGVVRNCTSCKGTGIRRAPRRMIDKDLGEDFLGDHTGTRRRAGTYPPASPGGEPYRSSDLEDAYAQQNPPVSYVKARELQPGHQVFVPHFMGEERLEGHPVNEQGYWDQVDKLPGQHEYRHNSEEFLMKGINGHTPHLHYWSPSETVAVRNPGRTGVRHTAPGGGEHAPYRIKEEGGKFYVVNDKGEKKDKGYSSHAEAREHQKALYANVPGARESAEEDEKKHGSRRHAGEGIVPSPGPNPNYFSQGTQGIQGPPSFPEDPTLEEHNNHQDGDGPYGDVPPQVSPGSSQGLNEGGYSRQGARGRLGFSRRADRTGPTIDSPEGYEYTPAPDWVTRATQKRFETSRPAAMDPKHPGHYLADYGNFWDGSSEVKDAGNGRLSYTSPYSGDTDHFDEHGSYWRCGHHVPWGQNHSCPERDERVRQQNETFDKANQAWEERRHQSMRRTADEYGNKSTDDFHTYNDGGSSVKSRPAAPGTSCDAGPPGDHPAELHLYQTNPTFGDEQSLGNVCRRHASRRQAAQEPGSQAREFKVGDRVTNSAGQDLKITGLHPDGDGVSVRFPSGIQAQVSRRSLQHKEGAKHQFEPGYPYMEIHPAQTYNQDGPGEPFTLHEVQMVEGLHPRDRFTVGHWPADTVEQEAADYGHTYLWGHGHRNAQGVPIRRVTGRRLGFSRVAAGRYDMDREEGHEHAMAGQPWAYQTPGRGYLDGHEQGVIDREQLVPEEQEWASRQASYEVPDAPRGHEAPYFKPGDHVEDFRGDTARVHRVIPSADPSKSHRVQVTWDEPGKNRGEWEWAPGGGGFSGKWPEGEPGDKTPYYQHVFRHHVPEIGSMIDEAVPNEGDIRRAYAHRQPAPQWALDSARSAGAEHARRGILAEPPEHPEIAQAYVEGYDSIARDGYKSHQQKRAATDGRIVGTCDHCSQPVRYHTEGGGHLRHLHNGSAKCSDGKVSTAMVVDAGGGYQARFKLPQFINVTAASEFFRAIPGASGDCEMCGRPATHTLHQSDGEHMHQVAEVCTEHAGKYDEKHVASHRTAYTDEHVERYVQWARANGHDPDTPVALKSYEKQPGIGRAHTDYIADQLYIGGGDQDWRRHQGAGRVQDHEITVRNAQDAYLHLGGEHADKILGPGGLSGADREQLRALISRAYEHGMPRQAAVLENPTADNPSGRGGDPYRAKTSWEGFEHQRPRQQLEGEGGMNANTPTTPQDPIRTGPSVNTPTPGSPLDQDGPRERGDKDEEDDDDD